MKFLHVADLHIGKIVNEFSMLEDQKFILSQIIEMATANRVDALVIAGDIYDRSIPTGEAVALFDSFLTELVNRRIQVVMISGNHDSPERISFGENLLNGQGVHIAGVYKDKLTKVIFEEKSCQTEMVLLPFCKPAVVNAANSEEAVRNLLKDYWEEENRKQEKKDEHKNRVLITHFFVTDSGREPELSDSETTIHIGGLDNVEASALAGFDYVALGHIHKPQQIGEHPIWYAGSPLCYSFGETGQNKTALMVTMGEMGLEEVCKLELHPLREMRKLHGELEVILRSAREDLAREDYIQAILTDRGELIDPIGTLRSVYPNVMQIVRESREQGSSELNLNTSGRLLAEKKDTLGLFEAFYENVKQESLPEKERKIVVDIVRELEK